MAPSAVISIGSLSIANAMITAAAIVKAIHISIVISGDTFTLSTFFVIGPHGYRNRLLLGKGRLKPIKISSPRRFLIYSSPDCSTGVYEKK